MEKLAHVTSHMHLGSSAQAGSDSSVEISSSVSPHLDQIYGSLTALSKSDFLKDIQHESHSGAVEGKELADPLASLATFHQYMASPASSAMRPAKKPDISAPITDYFISSSHNTYLTGNQLSSDSEASSYAHVLLNGCRCVEIDVWDGQPDSETDDDTSSSDSSSDEEKSERKKDIPKKKKGKKERKTMSSKLEGLLGRKSPSKEDSPEKHGSLGGTAHCPLPEPRVLHGHTLTKGTTFRDVCDAIRDNAFVASDLPVIVSLEVHACIEQQEKMVEIMEKAWKGLLVEVTPEIAATHKIPPLEDLKRKILIKVKYVAPSGEHSEQDDKDDKDDYTENLEKLQQEQSHNDANTAATKHEDPQPKKPSKICQSLSKLAVFTKGFHFSAFSQPEAKVPGHVFSLSEKAARAAYEKDAEALFEHNRRHFMRIYPYGLRVTSSNLDPTFYWRRGAQLVALNWQHVDKGMMLNRGMFAGEDGWVLKPEGYRSSGAALTPIARRQLDLSIEVLAAQKLPLPPGQTKEKGFHPYVSCYLHVETPEDETRAPQSDDATSDSEKSSYKREVKGFTGQPTNPDFGSQKLEFPTLAGIVEELTFVRFKVKDDEIGRDHLAAWACIKLDRLREGYRFIHLYDCSGSLSGGALLVRITKTIS